MYKHEGEEVYQLLFVLKENLNHLISPLFIRNGTETEEETDEVCRQLTPWPLFNSIYQPAAYTGCTFIVL